MVTYLADLYTKEQPQLQQQETDASVGAEVNGVLEELIVAMSIGGTFGESITACLLQQEPPVTTSPPSSPPPSPADCCWTVATVSLNRVVKNGHLIVCHTIHTTLC